MNISFFNRLIFEDVYLADEHADTLVYVGKVIAEIDSFSVKHENVYLSKVVLGNPTVGIERGLDSIFNYQFLIPPADTVEKAPFNWIVDCQSFEVINGKVSYLDSLQTNAQLRKLDASGLNFTISDIAFNSMSNIAFSLSNFALTTNQNFDVSEIAAKVSYSDSILVVDNLIGLLKNSNFHFPLLSFDLREYFQTGNIYNVPFDVKLEQLNLLLSDFNFIVPELSEFDTRALFYGNVSGTVASLEAEDLKIKIGNMTNLAGKISIDGLPVIEDTYFLIDLYDSYANLNEYRKLNVPESLKKYLPPLPAFLENLGVFRYEGSFTGFVDDFGISGGLFTNLGDLKADLFLMPNEDKSVKVTGHLNTHNFDLGALFQNNNVGLVSFNGEVDGNLQSNKSYQIDVDGTIQDIDFNNYHLSNILMDGRIRPNQFNGKLSINDENLKLSYFGSLDLSPENPTFSFIADIDHANLSELHLLSKDSVEIAAVIDANFEGKNIDLMKGEIDIEDISFKNELDSIHLDNFKIINSGEGAESKIEIYSNWFDAEIDGSYYLMNIYSSVMNLLDYYLPSALKNKPKEIDDINNFNFNVDVKNLSEIVKVTDPNLSISVPFSISGNYNPINYNAYLEASLPLIRYENKGIEGLNVRLYAEEEEFYTRVKADKIHLSKPVNIYNYTTEIYGSDDQLDLNVFWNNLESSTYSGAIRTSTSFSKTDLGNAHIELDIAPTKLYFADSLWNVNQASVVIDTTTVLINDFKLYNSAQQIYVDGIISENKTDELTAVIENVHLDLLKPLLGTINLSGQVNGQASIKDLYHERQLDMQLTIDSFNVNDGYLGELELLSEWNNETKKLETSASLIKNQKTLLDANGTIDPSKSETDLTVFMDETPVSILGIFMPSTFNNQGGFVNGTATITGKTNHLQLNGKLKPVTEASIGLTYLNTTYYFSDPIEFIGDTIRFHQLNFRDEKNNKGIFDGTITHQNFGNMMFDLSVYTDRIMGMNTTIADNDQFYGTAFASGHLSITGTDKNIEMSGRLRSEKGTSIFIPYESENNAKVSDFIVFVQQGTIEEKEVKYDVRTNGVEMNFDVEVTPDAEIQLIFNSQMGDIIKAIGVGDLSVQIDRKYNIEMYGNFTIEKGDYLFTLENIINKRFSIEKGGTIQWSGDPYNAMIDLTAVYKVKTTLKELFVNENSNIDLTRRIPVDCIIYLSDNLMQPNIGFDIYLPTVADEVQNEVDLLIVTEEDVNRQMISLLMMGNFYTPDILSGNRTTSTTSAMLGSTAGELISNQLSNWLSQISDNWNFGVNWRPGDEITNDQVELALSTQILNDRVTIDGNIANNANGQQTANTAGFVGDFDVNVKLTDNGKLQLKAYTHSNDDLNDDTASNTQGIGLTYREDFNSLKELWQKFKNLFTRNNKES